MDQKSIKNRSWSAYKLDWHQPKLLARTNCVPHCAEINWSDIALYENNVDFPPHLICKNTPQFSQFGAQLVLESKCEQCH